MFDPVYPNLVDLHLTYFGKSQTGRYDTWEQMCSFGVWSKENPQYVHQKNGVSFVLHSGDSADVWKGLKQERAIISAVRKPSFW